MIPVQKLNGHFTNSMIYLNDCLDITKFIYT